MLNEDKDISESNKCKMTLENYATFTILEKFSI